MSLPDWLIWPLWALFNALVLWFVVLPRWRQTSRDQLRELDRDFPKDRLRVNRGWRPPKAPPKERV